VDREEIRSEGAGDVLGDCFISGNESGRDGEVGVRGDSPL
jgi:hypothetical protein